MSGIKVPCHNCETRHLGCHSECEAYATYRKEYAKLRDAIKLEKAKQAEVTEYIVTAINKQKSRQNIQHLGWNKGR